ncbi:Tryptophanyl-tRNA synthetase [Alloactinosynnema sp. L-07]|uniref:tryptophan--tRNA ligase n=1 Tax=Alloactinosynnema sp. L-07 TaxID=1653480 RepID=UPI00065EF42B|nr:tryptophan--tRNA ligase [Alloactinosynnema sp. L-07]CRK61660.1 Tryptophanyl-tRNA synthetase [Alloactinosynnema sp. L-07]
MTRLSAITPSGHAHLGNHLGAIRRWANQGRPGDLYFVSDLHAMTVSYNPARLRVLSRELLAVLVAAGIEPDQVFVQSDLVRELGALSWILECACSYGEAARMTQFKQKSGTGEPVGTVRLGLLTYPVLMAADILLQGAAEVPVGDDQSQHVELARTLARRFNQTYGEVFTVPTAVMPPTAARVRDLVDPSRKMSKSTQDSVGVVFILDTADLIHRKIKRAVTDSVERMEYRPTEQPGLANLLEILSACTDVAPADLATQYPTYGALKSATAEAVVEELRPIREGAQSLLADPAELDRIRKAGAHRATERGAHRLSSALRLAGVA